MWTIKKKEDEGRSINEDFANESDDVVFAPSDIPHCEDTKPSTLLKFIEKYKIYEGKGGRKLMSRLVDQLVVLPFLCDVLEGKGEQSSGKLTNKQMSYAIGTAAGISEPRDILAAMRMVKMKGANFSDFSQYCGEFASLNARAHDALDPVDVAASFVQGLRPESLLSEAKTFMARDKANRSIEAVKSFALRTSLEMDEARRKVSSFYGTGGLVGHKSNPSCDWCGMSNHSTDECRKGPSAQVKKVKLQEVCRYCGRDNHASEDCRRKPSSATASAVQKQPRDIATVTCFRCKKQGHYANKCPKK